ncbi:OpgC domain-containing protein [Bradyrhizobium sp. CCBAU 65884]|uniref:OpgC domain-containing protein n=1 Tax=Bradyrhizobium sp. CCBAU 65884 TaxID=722477 RepID=UPI002304E9C7|nr:OpgC domain-containing protein [Bradyrhizobium sp. CCBAU 65884]
MAVLGLSLAEFTGDERAGNGVWFFNPLAWQLLIVLGGWYAIDEEKCRPWLTSRAALVVAVLYLVFSLMLSLREIKPLVFFDRIGISTR